MHTKLTSFLVAGIKEVAAVACISVVLIGPAAALDRLLLLGGIALRPWFENTCNEVEQIADMAVLETRRYRVLKLQAEAKSQVDHTASRLVDVKILWEKAPESVRAEAKADVDKAQQDLKAAAEREAIVNQQAPVVLRCIEQRKAELAAEATVGTPPGGGGAVASAPCGVGRGLVLTTSVNTTCSLNFAAIFGGLPASVLNDMRVETQPSHGRVEWSNGILTYTPQTDFRGKDSFTMSSSVNTAVEGKLVHAGRDADVWKVIVE
jgi:hypothetical protein